jgi:branched-chain amino acid transport system permease protein
VTRTLRIVLLVIVIAAAVLIPFVSGPYPLAVARSVLIYMALALSWDILLRSGQISFGIAGFFGIGAYAAALSVLKMSMPPVPSILFAGVIAGLVAFVLGFVILRLRAVYFSITTLALAEIFRVIIQNWGDFTGGPEGVVLPKLIFNGEAKALYWVALAAVLLACAFSAFFQRSKLRFALTAIRNNELSARSSGIHIFKYLMIAFVASSFLQGIIGGIQLQGYGFVSPDSVFDSYYTLLPLAMALLGGIYSTPGPILGAILLGVAAEYLKLKIPYGHLVVYGVIIVLVILLMPQGLYGLYRKRIKARGVSRRQPPTSGPAADAVPGADINGASGAGMKGASSAGMKGASSAGVIHG